MTLQFLVVNKSFTSAEVHITSLPYEITSPGHYVLDIDWTGYANPLIKISSSDVILDCTGRKLVGVSSGVCIKIEGVDNVTVYLPELESWSYGVYVYNSKDVTLTLRGNMTNCNHGVYLGYSKDCVVNGTFWIKSSMYGIHIFLSDRCNVTELNIADSSYGISVYNSEGCYFANLNFTNTSLYFEVLAPGKNHIVENCFVNKKPLLYLEDKSSIVIDGDYGEIVLLNCTNITLSGSVWSKHSLVDILDSENITLTCLSLAELLSICISNSKFISATGLSVHDSNHIFVSFSNNLTMTYCCLSSTELIFFHSNNSTLNSVSFEGLKSALRFEFSENNTVTNCWINGRPIVYLENAVGGLVSGNVGQVILINCTKVKVNVEISNVNLGIELSRCNNCSIKASLNNCYYGVYLRYSSNCTVETDANHVYMRSIDLFRSNNNVIANCTMNDCKTGIYSHLSDENIVTNCTISGAILGFAGISLSSSNTNLITDCRVSGYEQGIYLYHSDNCNITRCMIVECDKAIYLADSHNGFIYLNSFVDFDGFSILGDTNYVWYSPEPITYFYKGEHVGYLGNYYDDYEGVDSNDDGIGDSPYTKHDVSDPYPLVANHIYYREPVLEELIKLLAWEGVFNVTFIIGDTYEHSHTGWKAATADVIGAIRVAEALSRAIGAAFVETATDMKVAEYSASTVTVDWSKIKTPAIIVVGGPGVNYLTYKYNGTIPFSWIYIKEIQKSVIYSSITGEEYKCGRTSDGKLYDHAIIAVFRDPETLKLVVLIWGLSRHGTQAACLVLQNYSDFSEFLEGKAILIKWTDSNGNEIVDREDPIELVERWS